MDSDYSKPVISTLGDGTPTPINSPGGNQPTPTPTGTFFADEYVVAAVGFFLVFFVVSQIDVTP